MKAAGKPHRHTISLPPRLANQVAAMAGARSLNTNRMLLRLIEQGIDAENRKHHQFCDLAERLRNEQDPATAERLGDTLGRLTFGG